MSTSPDMAERHQRQLARYAEIAMRAAEKVDGQLDAACDPAALASLVGSLHKAGRVLRMSIALEARLARDQARDARDGEARDEALSARAIETRKAQVRHAVDRLIWTEYEKSDAEVLSAELDEDLDAEALADGFLAEPLEDHIARARTTMGVTGEPEWGYVPRAYRNQPQRFWRRPDAAGHDDEDEDAPDDAAAQAAPEPPPPEPDTPPGRLAPPMDLPSWECEPEPPPEPPPRPPDPPPPDPEPYVPPWERNPHARFPGGSGY